MNLNTMLREDSGINIGGLANSEVNLKISQTSALLAHLEVEDSEQTVTWEEIMKTNMPTQQEDGAKLL
jgi:hypothetical protein